MQPTTLCVLPLRSPPLPQELLIYGKQFGNVFIGVQPTFGYGAAAAAASHRRCPLSMAAAAARRRRRRRLQLPSSAGVACLPADRRGRPPPPPPPPPFSLPCSYEGDPMRLLFSRSASPHHGFAAYYTYLEKIFGVSTTCWAGSSH